MPNDAETGLKAAVSGFAHELIACGILMKRYQNVSTVNLPLSPYDIIVVLKKEDGSEEIIRGQAKTAGNNVSFTGGSRGGIDREYKSNVKKYRQSTKTSDVVIGVHPESDNHYDLYFVPTILIEWLDQDSISLSKISTFKNNYDILERCKDRKFVLRKSWMVEPSLREIISKNMLNIIFNYYKLKFIYNLI